MSDSIAPADAGCDTATAQTERAGAAEGGAELADVICSLVMKHIDGPSLAHDVAWDRVAADLCSALQPDSGAALVDACAVLLRERRYTVRTDDFPCGPEQAAIVLRTKPGRRYTMHIDVGPARDRLHFIGTGDLDTLAAKAAAWIAEKVPDLHEVERLLDMTLGIIPPRERAA